ncbi:hypothetical protein [Rhodospirillaceae bacterium SYSU D60014]|uniref:hypothetical protein n=1 Tax=Virgifigura deserti TaxID=2268457 RepID=UPI000E6637AE
MGPPNDLPQVANANIAPIAPQSIQQQIEELALCVDEITTQTALSSLTTILEAATADDDSSAVRASAVATELAEGAEALEAHIRRLIAAATST